MNPNSGNQRWSLWTFTVRRVGKGCSAPRTMTEIKENTARFVRKLFNTTAGEMKIDQIRGHLKISIRIEGVPVHDPQYCEYIKTKMTAFFVAGFGADTVVEMCSKLEAGTREDGTPADQLIVLPSLTLGAQDNG